MNIIKHLDFFNPLDYPGAIHIIGVGAIGSHVAEQLVRLGFTKLNLYDFDTVESANVANQMYYDKQIGMLKTQAICDTLMAINPKVNLTLFNKGYTHQALSGIVYLCVDNIDLRRKICEDNRFNKNIDAVLDIRMGLTDAQHFASIWQDAAQSVSNLINTMAFTHEEAQAAQPVSACGSTLSVLPTIRMITALAVANMINYIRVKELRTMILIDAFGFELDKF